MNSSQTFLRTSHLVFKNEWAKKFPSLQVSDNCLVLIPNLHRLIDQNQNISITHTRWELLECKRQPSFSIHPSVPKTHVFGAWISTLTSKFCLIQSLHNGRDALFPPHFSLLPYLGKLLQLQSRTQTWGWKPSCVMITWRSPIHPSACSPLTQPMFHSICRRSQGYTTSNFSANPQQVAGTSKPTVRKVHCKWHKRLTEERTVLWLGWMNAISAWQQNYSKNSRIHSPSTLLLATRCITWNEVSIGWNSTWTHKTLQ